MATMLTVCTWNQPLLHHWFSLLLVSSGLGREATIFYGRPADLLAVQYNTYIVQSYVYCPGCGVISLFPYYVLQFLPSGGGGVEH